MGIKIKQHDITDCGAACLASVSAFYKLKLPIARIRQWASTDKKGTNILGLLQAAEKLGFVAKGVRGDRESLSKIPLPAIAHVIVKEQLHHYVVLYKIDKHSVELMDPASGKMEKRTIEEFEKEWTGVLLLLMPSDDFQMGNQKVSILQRFLYLLSPHRTMLAQALTGAMVYTILGLATSIYIQKITDYVLVDRNANLLNLLSVSMLVILLLQLFISSMKSIFVLKIGQQIDARLILGYYKHLLKLPQRFFDTMRVGEIISRINDAVKIRVFINDTAIALVVNVFIVFFSFTLMFLYSWKLALLMLVIIPLYVLVYILINKLNKKIERKVMEKSADLESQLVESLNSVRTIKEFGLEQFANTKTETRFISLLHSVYKSGLNSVFATNSTEFLSRLFTILLLWTGSFLVLDGEITPGELLSFYAIIGYFTQPAAGLIGMNKTMQNALIAADRLFEIMDLEREDTKNQMELTPQMIGDIHFEQVAFSYGSRASVFTDFSLTIPKGKITAIIGESGSGKTTLMALLQKLYPIDAGKIRIGAHDITYLTHESLRSLVGVVPQKLDLFAGNVIENIAVGVYNPNMEQILEICSQLGILSFIESLPNGFATYLGENGTSLSGGQKQRIAIARALYKEPEILLLDEATSALDSGSEKYVHQTLAQLCKAGKTIILITHRLSSVLNVDHIVLLDQGKVAEQGTHQSLYQDGTQYYQLWQQQLPSLKEL